LRNNGKPLIANSLMLILSMLWPLAVGMFSA
jgi:hypothetical protein